MKKILALVFAVTVVFGIGEGVKEATNQAGNPPVGDTTTNETADGGFTTYGNPPIGG